MTWAALTGIAVAQPPSEGTVQLGQPPAAVQADPRDSEGTVSLGTAQPPVQALSPQDAPPQGLPPLDQAEPVNPGGYFGIAPVDQRFKPRFNVDSRGGGLYGYQGGYSTLGMFAPFQIEGDDALLFVDVRGLVTYDNQGGGANVGAGWRWWDRNLDRITGLSAWYDNSSGGIGGNFSQIGLSFESLGRYVDYRINGYIPAGNANHVGSTAVTVNPLFNQSNIVFQRSTLIAQGYTGFDVETGGPLPVIGRYGVNGYLGGYHFMGAGAAGGSFTGVSGRFISQINEDVSFGMQVTNDHTFGLNTQFQVFVTLPDGTPSRWMRNLRVQDRLTQSVFRQFRAITHIDNVKTLDTAIDPATAKPYFVAHINPAAATTGNGTNETPFQSIAAYNALSAAQQRKYDVIYVSPASNNTLANLDTKSTLTLYSDQRLLSTSLAHTFTTTNFPGRTFAMPGLVAAAAGPALFNSAGNNVVTIAANATNLEISGFTISGSATGNGVVGSNNQNVSINNDTIQDALNGVQFTNLSGTVAAGTSAQVFDNVFQNNVNNGFQVVNTGAAPLELVAVRNTFLSNSGDGLQLNANAGSVIGGVIGAPDLTATVLQSNTFDSNGANGVHLTASGGTLDFQTVTAAVNNGITNNKFFRQAGTGLLVDSTNNSTLRLNVSANTFGGDPKTPQTSSGNLGDAILINADSGITNLVIGGATAAAGNTFNDNLPNGIVLNLTGTSDNTVNVDFNTFALTSSGGGNIFLTGHDIDFHDGQNGYDNVVLNFLRGAGTSNAIPANQFSLAVLGSGVGQWQLSNGTQIATGFKSTTFYNLTTLAANPALWNQVFAANGIIILSDETVGGGDTSAAGVATINSQSARFAQAISSGTSVWANAGASDPNYYNWLPPGVVASGAPINAIAGFTATPAGVALGITDVAPTSMINGFPTHNSFPTFDPAFTVFENFGAVAASIGVQGAVINASGFVKPGEDAIQLNTANTAILHASTINNNTISGYGVNAIHVTASGTSQDQNLSIQSNTVTGSKTGTGVLIERNDSALVNAVITQNSVTGTGGGGLSVFANGSAIPNVSLQTSDNTFTLMSGNGMAFNASGASIINVSGERNVLTKNQGNGMSYITAGSAQINSLFNNTTVDGNTLNGLTASSSGTSAVNLLFASPADPLVTTRTSFSGNNLNGMVLAANDASQMNVNIDSADINKNVIDGLSGIRGSTAAFNLVATSSSFSTNGANGMRLGFGGNTIPNSFLTLAGNSFDNNVAGDGLSISMAGASVLQSSVTASTFNTNGLGGIRVVTTASSSFGTLANAALFDGVSASNNAAGSGILLQTATTDPTGSSVLAVIESLSGNTDLSSNGTDGVTVNGGGLQTNVQISADGIAGLASGFTTTISSNKGNGINFTASDSRSHVVSVNDATIASNTADGVRMVVTDSVNPGGLDSGRGTLNVGGVGFGNLIQANTGDGLHVVLADAAGTGTETAVVTAIENTINQNTGDGLHAVLAGAANGTGAGIGTLTVTANGNAINQNSGNGVNLVGIAGETYAGPVGTMVTSFTGNTINNNSLNGVNIAMTGHMGTRATANQFRFVGNQISSNLQDGLLFTSDAGPIPNFFSQASLPAGTPRLILSTQTATNSNLGMYQNQVTNNGTLGSAVGGVGVALNISTSSYLSADLGGAVGSGNGNTFGGNAAAIDLQTRSFVTGGNPPNSIPGSAIPPIVPDIIFAYNTAQLDLRFHNNTGNAIAPSLFPGQQANYGASNDVFGLRLASGVVQLFQVDGPAGSLSAPDNVFTKDNGVTFQNIDAAFTQGMYHIRAASDPLFPNPAFPTPFPPFFLP